MAADNSSIMQAVWLSGTNDFQQRIPEPTVHTLAETERALFSPMNRAYLNQFVDILINKVAFTIVRGKRWENPLAVFEKRRIDYGSTIEEVALKWIKAHSYRDDWGDRADDITNLLKVNRPDGSVAYHSINRRDTYPISINEMELQEAFHSEYGLNELIARIMDLPANSDAYDTYQIMLQLLKMYEDNWGFFKVNLSSAPVDETTGKEFLTKVRGVAGRLSFPSSLFNALTVQDIPTFANPSELVLLVTPETQAVLDVETLAALFHLDKAEIQYRTIIVDRFPIDGAVALLTTEDFFVVHDKVYMTTSFFNPQTLTTNYYLHHISVNSVSPFVPAVLFTTQSGTIVPTVTQSISAITLVAKDSVSTVSPGGTVELIPGLTGTLSGTPQENLILAPSAMCYTVLPYTDDPDNGGEVSPDYITPYTYVDRFNVLHIADDIDPDDVGYIRVIAETTYSNPSGVTPAISGVALGFTVS